MQKRYCRHYTLIDRNAVETTFDEWAMAFESTERIVQQDTVSGIRDGEAAELFVSTVFLGLNHDWDEEGPPLIFETMVFHGTEGLRTERCSTWEQALEQHRAILEETQQKFATKH